MTRITSAGVEPTNLLPNRAARRKNKCYVILLDLPLLPGAPLIAHFAMSGLAHNIDTQPVIRAAFAHTFAKDANVWGTRQQEGRSNVQCGHCSADYHPQTKALVAGRDEDSFWQIEVEKCPRCRKFNMRLVNGSAHPSDPSKMLQVHYARPFYPKEGSSRKPAPVDVPKGLAEDYNEACLVLNDSPKASAALSRRCLQAILRDHAKTKSKDLADQIDEVLAGNLLPSHLAGAIDAVRNLGNFAAHPVKSKSSGEIVEVEQGEADWLLETLEGLFDFYFVQPADLQKKRDALNAKLAAAGKPQLK